MKLIFAFCFLLVMPMLPTKAKSPTCPTLSIDTTRIWSKRALEDAMIAQLPTFTTESGALDWHCLAERFTQLSSRTAVQAHPGGGFENADVYRFKLDRSNNVFAVIREWGPGASNGVFVAIFNQHTDGRVAVIRRGGKPQVVALE